MDGLAVMVPVWFRIEEQCRHIADTCELNVNSMRTPCELHANSIRTQCSLNVSIVNHGCVLFARWCVVIYYFTSKDEDNEKARIARILSVLSVSAKHVLMSIARTRSWNSCSGQRVGIEKQSCLEIAFKNT